MSRTVVVAATVVLLLATACKDGEPAGPFYQDCAAARSAGAAPLHKGDPGYRSDLDRDGDGVACDK